MIARLLIGLLCLTAIASADNVPEQVIEDYLSAAEPAEKKGPWTTIKVALGITVTDGNSDTITGAFSFEAVREWGDWKLTLKETSIYGESNGVESANEHIFIERLERKLNEKLSIFQELLAEHDEQEKLSLRLQFAVGVTYFAMDRENFDMWVDLGFGVLYEDYRPTGDDTSAIAVVTIRWKWQITKDLLYEQKITIWPSLSDGGEFRLISESIFSTPVGENMKLQLIIIDTYNSQPPLGNKHNDLVIILTLVINF